MSAARPIRFVHRGRVVEVGDAATTRTLLDWLREDARCTGTKEGCNEGDCGACTVVLAERVPGADGTPALALAPVNACLQFLPAVDGKAVLTVEDLARGDALHPVQRAMVECHASQCGFCTPGFVMTLFALRERHRAAGTRPSREQVADALSGNLCRCTGYRPIVDAGMRMVDSAGPELDAAPLHAALDALAARAREDDAAEAGTFRYVDPAGARYRAPTTLAAFADERLADPAARVLGGCTDIGLWTNKQFRALPSLLATGRVAELRTMAVDGELLRIGAAVPLEDAWRELATRWPALGEMWLRFAGAPIRHAGTLGGNVANGSPIGDAPPVLMALDATLLLRRGSVERRLPLADFYLGYMQNELAEGEFLQAIEVPLPTAAAGHRTDLRAWKISKRFDCDISAVSCGLFLERDADDRIVAARLAFGGMAATVQRAAAAEAALVGRAWDRAALGEAQAALGRDYAPMSDLRASASYRLRVAANLLERLWLETRRDAPLAAAATRVWPLHAARAEASGAIATLAPATLAPAPLAPATSASAASGDTA